ncbi:MAG: hypothetical protein Q9169_002651 [Polycauliona sp. 2 TL-2023]
MSGFHSLQIHPGRSLGFLILGASLHDVLSRLKAQPHLYPTIDVSYSPTQPLVAPVILNLPANGFRLRFDGRDQRLRLIEILDFGKTQLSYKNIDLVKLPEESTTTAAAPSQQGPIFRHVYNRLMGPTFPGQYLAPTESTGDQTGLYVLSYPGIAFTFPLQHSAWSPKADFVSLLSSNAAAPAKSLAIFNGASWHEARKDLFIRPCPHPRSLALSMKGKEFQPDEIELAVIFGGGEVDLCRRSSSPFRIVLGETTPQDLVAELGPPDAIYRKNDHRLSIHKARRREPRSSHGSYGASPAKSEDFFDTDHSSAHTTTDDSDAEEDTDQRDDDPSQATAKCFYNYFHHGFDIFISYPSGPSPQFPNSSAPAHPPSTNRATDRLVATKVILHGNVPGSYPFNRHRRSQWMIDPDTSGTGTSNILDSETSFTSLSSELRNIWKGNYGGNQAEKATQNAIVLDRDWGDSPGSSYEVLEGWEDGEQTQKRGTSTQEGSGSGTTQIFGFPGMLFEVLKNDVLPRSLLPPVSASVLKQQDYLKRCTDHLYASQQETRNGRPGFVLHDGPPFANGPLHIGHALNKVLKDITCRFQLALGKRVTYVPGWDCHGLPIEIKAIEKAKQQNTRLDVSADPIRIRKAASLLATDAIAKQKAAFQQWGIMADWKNPWKTMDPDFELRQLEVFSTMVKKGLINRRFKPVHWSPSSRTALAEAELEYREDHKSTAVYVKYPMEFRVNDEVLTIGLVIWTTTPWTLPANKAIAVNTEFYYAHVKSREHGHVVIAKAALPEAKDYLGEDYEVIQMIHGRALAKQTYFDPIELEYSAKPQPRPILHADYVSPYAGTGLVHSAPGHGMDDYELCLKHGIEAFAPVDDAGCFSNLVLPGDQHEKLNGKAVLNEGTEAVLDLFESVGALVKRHPFVHKYPYDWRTKQPLIIRATEQWFANVGQIQAEALESLDTVRFVPESGKDRLRSFITGRKEWCMSRQRAWGVPIPALYHEGTGEALLTAESVDHVITQIRSRGIDAWWSDDSTDPEWVAPLIRARHPLSKFRRGKDTMDVWFDSGTSWTHTAKEGKAAPADVYLEGSDQHRGWFQSSLLTYIAQHDHQTQAPFKSLVTHGFVLDSEGRKMSKSIGNVISPDEIINGTLLPPPRERKNQKHETLGPDALRLWVAMSDYTTDVRVNVAVLENVRQMIKKYRGSFKFMLGNLRDFEGPMVMKPKTLQSPHRIALLHLEYTFRLVHTYYSEGDYSKAISEINRYVINDLSGFYIESVRDVLYLDRGERRKQAQFTMLIIHQCLQTMLAPITPVLIEETWDHSPTFVKEHYPHPLTVLWAQLQGGLDIFHDDELAADMPILRKAIAAVNYAQGIARKQGLMGSGVSCCVLLQVQTSGSSDAKISRVLDCFERHGSELAMMFAVSGVEVVREGVLAPDGWAGDWMASEVFHVKGVQVIAHIHQPSKAKCVRCWRFLAPPDVPKEVALCERCNTVVDQLTLTNPELFESRPPAAAAAGDGRLDSPSLMLFAHLPRPNLGHQLRYIYYQYGFVYSSLLTYSVHKGIKEARPAAMASLKAAATPTQSIHSRKAISVLVPTLTKFSNIMN